MYKKIDVILYMFYVSYTACYILYKVRQYLMAFLGICIFVGCVSNGTVFAEFVQSKPPAEPVA